MVKILNFYFFLTAIIVRDRESGKSRGFGFVTFKNQEDADAAVKADEVVSLILTMCEYEFV